MIKATKQTDTREYVNGLFVSLQRTNNEPIQYFTIYGKGDHRDSSVHYVVNLDCLISELIQLRDWIACQQ